MAQVLISTLPIYSLWQLILAIDGAYHRNTIQIIGLSIFNALFLAWAALQVCRSLEHLRGSVWLIPNRIQSKPQSDL